jgi:NTE family protein
MLDGLLRRHRRLLRLAAAMLGCSIATASIALDEAATAGAGAPRPRIGLVLAGGGAKGGAHLGVLKVLEEMHIPIDCIAGTSMGALVGGGYASGIPADKLQAFVESINWKNIVGGMGGRSTLPIERKRQGVTYSNQLQLGIKGSQIVVAPGLINTSAIDDLLRGFVSKARHQTDFDQLPIPYRAVATDMVSGHMVVLDHGDLATAMRASMALPGVFAPVQFEHHILADGGLVRNIPVDVARTMCADVVIVVNLVSPPADPEELRAPRQLLGRTIELMIEANEQLQLQSLAPSDVRIDVPLGNISTGDFERTGETVALGVAAARLAAPQLARFAVTPDQYLAWRTRVTEDQSIASTVDTIRMAELKRVNPLYLDQLAGIAPGEHITTEELSHSVQRMAAVEDIDSVGYELTGDPAHTTLQWLPYEKSWAPDFIKLDLGMYASTTGDDRGLAFYLQHTRTWVDSLGAQWRNELQLGTNQTLASSFYQPLDVPQRIFVEPKVFWDRDWQNVFYGGDDVARYQFDDRGGRFDFGSNFGNAAQVRIGYFNTERHVQIETGAPALPQLEVRDAGIAVAAIYDTRDTPFSPTRGLVAALEYFDNDRALGAGRSWQRAEFGLSLAVPFRNNVMRLDFGGGSSLQARLPADRLFSLGGPVSLAGAELNAIRADAYWTMSGSYLWRIKDLFSLRGQALYAGLRLQALEAYQTLDGRDQHQIGSVSIFVTGRTPVGPLTAGLATTTINSHILWISFGRPIAEGTLLSGGFFR